MNPIATGPPPATGEDSYHDLIQHSLLGELQVAYGVQYRVGRYLWDGAAEQLYRWQTSPIIGNPDMWYSVPGDPDLNELLQAELESRRLEYHRGYVHQQQYERLWQLWRWASSEWTAASPSLLERTQQLLAGWDSPDVAIQSALQQLFIDLRAGLLNHHGGSAAAYPTPTDLRPLLARHFQLYTDQSSYIREWTGMLLEGGVLTPESEAKPTVLTGALEMLIQLHRRVWHPEANLPADQALSSYENLFTSLDSMVCVATGEAPPATTAQQLIPRLLRFIRWAKEQEGLAEEVPNMRQLNAAYKQELEANAEVFHRIEAELEAFVGAPTGTTRGVLDRLQAFCKEVRTDRQHMSNLDGYAEVFGKLSRLLSEAWGGHDKFDKLPALATGMAEFFAKTKENVDTWHELGRILLGAGVLGHSSLLTPPTVTAAVGRLAQRAAKQPAMDKADLAAVLREEYRLQCDPVLLDDVFLRTLRLVADRATRMGYRLFKLNSSADDK